MCRPNPPKCPSNEHEPDILERLKAEHLEEIRLMKQENKGDVK